MLSKASPRETDFTAPATTRRTATNLINHKIWLPKALYDGLPFFYIIAGLSALAATLYIGAWYWVVPHYILFSAGCLHVGLIVFRKRRGSNAPPDSGTQSPDMHLQA